MTTNPEIVQTLYWPPSLDVHFDLEFELQGFRTQEDKTQAGKTLLQKARQAFEAAFKAGVVADDLVHGRAFLVDRILQIVWQEHTLDEYSDLSLIAVGGYGRGELLPASDIDLLLLCSNTPNDNSCEKISKYIRQLWDMGLKVGHSVRTLDECEAEAIKDVTVVTNLMESRLLAGHEPLFGKMLACIDPDHIWPSRQFFEAKLEEQKHRHRKFGDSAYGLEPNIKEGPGGLRDIQMIGWVSKRHLRARRMSELVHHGFLTHDEYIELKAGQTYLWRLRFALHTLTGRSEDRLLFDHQRALAELFGYHDENANLGVEQFMQAYYRTVMRLERLNEMLLQHYKEAILYADVASQPIVLNAHFQMRLGFIEVRDTGVFETHPSALLELFLISARHPQIQGVRASTIRLLRQYRHLIDEKFRQDPVNHALFLDILRQPKGVTHQLRRMNRYGILPAYIPPFAQIVGRMQYDLFHIYTVDEHTLMVVRNIRRYSLPEFAEETPGCDKIFARIPAPEVLYLAALFHDIGKGRGGNHAELGAADAEKFCRLHHLPENQIQLVSWLVRNHLLMSMTAQRKDIGDPEVIRTFAKQVGSTQYLDHLYLLTIADIRATNPSLWNSWRQSLLTELYQSTTNALEADLQIPSKENELIAEIQNDALKLLRRAHIPLRAALSLWEEMSEDYFLRHTADEIAWHTQVLIECGEGRTPLIHIRLESARGGSEICVYSEDKPYLFAHVTTTLDRLGLDIVDARLSTARHGRVLDTFIVLEENGLPITDEYRLQEIKEQLGETMKHLDTPPKPLKRRLPQRLRHFEVPTQIDFIPQPESHETAILLRTSNRPGLLSAIAQVLAAAHLRLHSARIATIGEQVEDIFFVSEEDGDALLDLSRQQEIRLAIQNALSDRQNEAASA